MSENKFKELVIAFDECFDDLKIKLLKNKEKFLDILSENMFINGYDGFFQEGLSTYARGRYKRAIYYFEKANQEQRNNFSCLYNLALAYQADNSFDDAIKYYLEALKINEKDYDTIYNLGLCYLNKKNGELAEQYLKLVLENTPKDSSVKMSYILSLVILGKIDEAIKLTIEIVKSNKTYIEFVLTVAKCIQEQSFGEKDVETIGKVIKLLNSYLKICPNSSAAQIEISICYGKMGNWELALKHSLMALELDSKSYEINKHTGLVHYCNHNYEEALKFYEKALFLNPVKNFDMHYNIALTYEKLGQSSDLEKKVNYILLHFKKHPQIGAVQELLPQTSDNAATVGSN